MTVQLAPTPTPIPIARLVSIDLVRSAEAWAGLCVRVAMGMVSKSPLDIVIVMKDAGALEKGVGEGAVSRVSWFCAVDEAMIEVDCAMLCDVADDDVVSDPAVAMTSGSPRSITPSLLVQQSLSSQQYFPAPQ